MYIHLGEDTVVNSDSIIAMIDMENATVSKNTREFLKTAEKEKRVINVSESLPRSAILCSTKDGILVYISQISTSTLSKRAQRTEVLV